MNTMPRLLPTLQLMRFALVYTAISNVWLVAFISRSSPQEPAVDAVRQMPMALLLLCTALVAGGLYVFGMVLNDVLDVRRDKVFAPNRPLPSGRMSVAAAIAIAFTALLIAVAASVPLGAAATFVTLITATLILFYDALAKHDPGIGVLTLGLIRGADMLIANPDLAFAWPVWWNFTHILTLSAICYALERKRPLFSPRDGWIVTGGWAFVTISLIMWMGHRDTMILTDHPWVWVGPLGAAVVFIAMGVRTVHVAPDKSIAGAVLMRRGLLYLIVYDAAWLVSAAMWWQAAVLAALLVMAYGSMLTMRNLSAALGAEPRYIRDGKAT